MTEVGLDKRQKEEKEKENPAEKTSEIKRIPDTEQLKKPKKLSD